MSQREEVLYSKKSKTYLLASVIILSSKNNTRQKRIFYVKWMCILLEPDVLVIDADISDPAVLNMKYDFNFNKYRVTSLCSPTKVFNVFIQLRSPV